jgi:hypothetical protein
MRILAAATLILLTHGAFAQPPAYLIEAEHTTLAGVSQVQSDTEVGGGQAVWAYGGSAQWDVPVQEGTYRVYARVRAGWADDHSYGVTDGTLYQAEVDGKAVRFSLVPGSLTYFGDDDNWAWLVADAGPLARGPHTIVLTAKWHYGRWDTLALSADPAYMPAAVPPFGPETVPDLSLLSQDARLVAQGFTAWNAPIEQNCSPSSRPDVAASTERVTVRACRNEHAPVAINVTNRLKETLSLRVSVAPGQSGMSAAKPLPATAIVLQYAVPLKGLHAEPMADALPRLDGAGLLHVPAGETRQLWLDISTIDLASGEYAATLQLRPLEGSRRCPPQEIGLSLTVLPIELPRRHPLAFYTNEYDNDQPGMAQDMPGHYVSVYQVCSVPPTTDPQPDFSAMDRWVRQEMGYEGARMVLFEQWWFRKDESWKQPAKRRQWVEGMRRWARHVHETLGLGYDQFVLHIYDEQAGPAVDDFLAARAIVREADPRVRVTVTISPSTSLAEVQKMRNAADIWAPYMSHIHGDPEMMEFLHSTGKPIWPYQCGEDKRFWPLENYLLWPWQLRRAGAQGLWLWTYISGDAWNGREWDGGVVYRGNGCVVTSRRWEVLREGMEDWLLLQAAQDAGQGRFAARAVEAALAPGGDAARVREWRERLMDALARPRHDRQVRQLARPTASSR